jgi:hypothetical protein
MTYNIQTYGVHGKVCEGLGAALVDSHDMCAELRIQTHPRLNHRLGRVMRGRVCLPICLTPGVRYGSAHGAVRGENGGLDSHVREDLLEGLDERLSDLYIYGRGGIVVRGGMGVLEEEWALI